MRSEGYILVTCDTCSTDIKIELAGTIYGYEVHEVAADLAAEGWTTTLDGQDICPDCREEQ
jgi:hypothetical protein